MGLNALILKWIFTKLKSLDEDVRSIYNVLEDRYVRKDIMNAKHSEIIRRIEIIESKKE